MTGEQGRGVFKPNRWPFDSPIDRTVPSAPQKAGLSLHSDLEWHPGHQGCWDTCHTLPTEGGTKGNSSVRALLLDPGAISWLPTTDRGTLAETTAMRLRPGQGTRHWGPRGPGATSAQGTRHWGQSDGGTEGCDKGAGVRALPQTHLHIR